MSELLRQPKRSLPERFYLWLHNKTYQKRLNRQTRFGNIRIVSVGNLSAGGTGKTPVSRAIARIALENRHSVAVVLRGYGGSRSKEGGLVSDGRSSFMNPSESGDEACLFAMEKGLKVAVGQDRAAVIRKYVPDADFLILDDAFQNPSVFRDLEIVLIDASVGPQRFRLIPAGKFREDLDALKRADVIVLTRTAIADPQYLSYWQHAASSAGCEVFEVKEKTSIPQNPNGARQLDPAEVTAFCGIGNPDSFYKSLEQEGFRIRKSLSFADHHAYSGADIRKITGHEGPYVTTEKDYVKLNDTALFKDRLFVCKVQVQFDRPDDFFRIVMNGP